MKLSNNEKNENELIEETDANAFCIIARHKMWKSCKFYQNYDYYHNPDHKI